MPTLPNWTLLQESRTRMAELLRTTSELGLDPDAAAAGGLAALQALIALKRAKDAGEGVGRERLIAQVQQMANRLDPTAHADLLQQIQSRVLALQGRNGATEVAHVTPGEIVLPEALQTPAVLGALRKAAGASRIPLEQLRVGSPLNSINPRTSQPEFFSLSSKESSSGQRYCELPDGRMVPYTDVGFGYAEVADGGTITDVGAGVGAGHAVAGMNWPNESKDGGLAAGGKSGKVTSSASRILRDATDSAKFAPLRPITGTASVGGSLARALPVIRSGMMLMDYLRTKDELEEAPVCKPLA